MLQRNFGADTTSPETLPRPVAAAKEPAKYNGADPAANHAASVIGTDLTVIGNGVTLISQSTLVIAGEVSGDANGDWVTVAETGKVQGTITARAVSVYGQVHGALRATTVTLHSTARVNCDILQIHLIIAEGAQFDGNVQKARSEAELPLLVEAPDQATPAQSY